MARLFLIDGSNQAFRAHFALPPRHTADGFPTRVLYGFTQLIHKLRTTWQPDYVAFAFDKGATFRNDLFADYKGHRPEMPEDLRQQWPHLTTLIEALGYRAFTVAGFEADDVLGTFATRFARQRDDLEVYIVTSDKDFGQLVNDQIQILNDSKGEVVDYAGVVERWGVPPERVIDLLALCGDASDNIPGVTKVGEKTAAKLIQEHGALEQILAAAAEGRVKGAVGQRLVEEADVARLSYTLATIHTEVPLPETLEDLAPRAFDVDAAAALFDGWEFGAVARRLLGERASGKVVAADVERATPDEARKQWLAGRRPVMAPVYTEDGTLRGFAAAGADLPAAWVPTGDLFSRAAILDGLADPSLPKVVPHAKPLVRALLREGRDLGGLAGDLRLLDYVLSAHRKGHDLVDLASRHLDHTLGLAARALQGEAAEVALAVESADVALALHARLEDKLTPGMRDVYTAMELPLVGVLARMEHAGLALDVAALAGVDADLAARLTEVEAGCHALAGHAFSLRSRHELRDVLFEELKLPGQKKVKDGWSTDSDVLEALTEHHELPARVLEYRALDKLRGTYLTKLPGFVGDDGRIHTTFLQDVAATGRLASNDPNLQNIPIRTFEGRRIRACFVPKPGHRFVSADYSQVELRVLAHVTQDPVLLEGFRQGADIHARTATELFGVPAGEVTVAQRSAAKAINFGLLYGMSAFRLARELGISGAEAQGYVEAYFARMPNVKGWIEATKADAKRTGWVETLFGRRRMIPEIHSAAFQERSAGEREAVNTVIQGTAADLIKRAMLRAEAAVDALALGATLVLQVHDELLFEVPDAAVEAVRAAVVAAMQDEPGITVPLAVSSAVGATWNEAHG